MGVHESLRNLRLDRRLLGRRGWLSAKEVEAELATLPDVGSKAAPPEDPEGPERTDADERPDSAGR